MLEANSSATPMSTSSKLFSGDSELFSDPSFFRSTVGALQYLTLTRPDLSFTVNKLSQFLQAPTALHWQVCKRVLRYIQGTKDHGLKFTPAAFLDIECYADADWGSNIEDRRSTSGYCVFLGPNLIQWSSRKQKVVALSSTEAEYRALAHTTTEIAWLNSIFAELGLSMTKIPVIWYDNVSAGALASNPVFHARTKHIEIDTHYIREQVLAHKIVVQYVPSKLQIADILKKALPAAQFEELKVKLNVVPCCFTAI
ncbi:secreted RxLR effector protein 161-like [Pistacia vera]|uniref:secreted RxLR effector protein 161-like n=1 Tax=Pistacia vera TaxID=55513 RepID=UPI0012637B43|nr:secreted RxLR effector protein 161-like [Pistacia vera]